MSYDFASALPEVLRLSGLPSQEVDAFDEEELEQLLLILGADPADLYEVIDAVNLVVPEDALGEGRGRAVFDLTVGEWSIDLSRAGLRAAVMSALIAGVLAQQGLVEFSVGMVTAILPSIVDIERVELDPGDRRMIVELRLKDKVRSDAISEDELYRQLPRQAQKVVSKYEFARALERIKKAGLADVDERGWISLKNPDERRSMVRWK